VGIQRRASVGGLALGLILSVLPMRPAAAAPGDVDPSFGGGDGRVPVSAGFDVDSMVANEIEVAPDGGTFVLTELPSGGGTGPAIVRFGADGAIDASWNNGNPVFPSVGYYAITIGVDASNRLIVATDSLIKRYAATGTLDQTFSGDGTVDLGAANALEMRDIEALPGGAVAVLGNPEAAGRPRIVRLTVAGAFDSSFSGDGRLEVPPPDPPANQFTQGLDLDVDASGNLYTLAVDVDRQLSVAKVSASGDPVAAFGGNGVAAMPGHPPNADAELAVDASARPTAIVPISGAFEVARLTAAGDPDEAYGPGGLVTIPAPNAVGQPIAVAGDTAYVSTCFQGAFMEAAVVAIDLPGAALRTTFGPGGADGDGVRVLPTNPADEACSGPIDVTSSGHPRVFIRPLELFGGPSTRPTELVQLTPTGADDLAYSDDARSPAGLRHHHIGRPTAIADGPAGQLVVGGDTVTAGSTSPVGAGFVGKVSSAGVAVPGFGAGGRAEIPSASGEPVDVLDIVVLPDGRVAVLHSEGLFDPGLKSYVTVLDATGEPDATFGGDGTTAVGVPSSSRAPTSITVAGTGADLALFVGGRPPGTGTDVYVQRVTLAGSIDGVYGAADGSANGWVGVDFPMRDDVINNRLLAGATDGSVVWAAPAITPGPGDGLALGKLLASGAIDSTFGSGGVQLVPGAAGPATGTLDTPMHLERRVGGGVDLLAARYNGFAGMVAVRISATGVLDPTYSGDGLAVLMSSSSDPIVGAAMQGDRAVFLQDGDTLTTVARLTSSGTPDASLGAGGMRSSTYPFRRHVADLDQGDVPTNLMVDAAGGIVFASRLSVTPPGETAGVDVELVKVRTEPEPPAPPSVPTAVRGDGLATVSWSPPVSDGGSAVTGYTVLASPGGSTCSTAASVTGCVVHGLTNGQQYTFTVTATNAVGTSAASAASAGVTPVAGAGAFVPLASPRRIVDSRNPSGDTDDEVEERFGALPGGTTRTIPVAGRVGLTGEVSNVVLSVAAVAPSANGYFTVFPCGTSKPLASSMNFTKGVTLANTVITKLGVGGVNAGKVCVYSNVTTNVVIDVSGSLTSEAFAALPSPKRIVDSRNPAGDTDDEQQERFGALPGGTTRTIPVTGRVGLAGDVENVVLTVAAVAPGANGFFTLYPCGTTRPLASSMNFTKGTTLANTVITKLSAAGTVCVYSNVTTDVVIDVSGSLPPAAFAALPSPQRIVDSRNPAGDTDDEQQERFGALVGGATRTIPVAGRVGLAGDVENVVLSVAAVAPGANGFFTLYPCGTAKPLASSMNFTKGTTLANTVITKLSAAGTVCVYTSATTNIVIDVSGSLR